MHSLEKLAHFCTLLTVIAGMTALSAAYGSHSRVPLEQVHYVKMFTE